MKLSQNTISILKHAASIHPGICIDQGDMIFSVHESRTVRMQAKVEETFPQQFALMNLNQFLNTLALIDDPELTFYDGYCVISSPSGNQTMQYYFSDPEIVQQPNKTLKAELVYNFSFNLSCADFVKLNRAAGAINADDICVFNRGAEIYMSALNKRRQTGNTFELLVGSDSELEGKEYKVFFRKNNLKLTNNDFLVSISDKGISTWKATDAAVPELLFHVAIERDSEFK